MKCPAPGDYYAGESTSSEAAPKFVCLPLWFSQYPVTELTESEGKSKAFAFPPGLAAAGYCGATTRGGKPRRPSGDEQSAGSNQPLLISDAELGSTQQLQDTPGTPEDRARLMSISGAPAGPCLPGRGEQRCGAMWDRTRTRAGPVRTPPGPSFPPD